jgi:heme oxygenase
MWSALEAATRDCHPVADERWLEMVNGVMTLPAYRDHLVTVYGFEAPIEAAFAMTPRLGLVLDLRAHARAGWIVHDLFGLGMRPAKLARLPQCIDILPFLDPVEALGWLYVVERSTRFHKALGAAVAHALPSAPMTYLSTPSFELRKAGLESALERAVTSDAAHARVIDAARDAFACQREWFERDVRISSPHLLAVR